ncbi:MAG: hypothetical protein MJ252_16475, partial [archaeon]|nr:hypothetical protein [archaeon]
MFDIISNNERSFLIKKLNNNPLLRDTKRDEKTYRPVSIKKLSSNGQVEVKIGNTLVITQLMAKLIKPSEDKPNEGQIVFQIDTNHLKPNADYNQQNEELTDFRNRLNIFISKTLKESKALDIFSLCIIPEQVAWKIIIDINIINNDGNVLDACLISILASWLTFRLPFLIKKENKLVNNNKYIYLTTLHKPFMVSFGIFETEKEGNKFIVDCNLKEESVMKGKISIAANIFGEVVFMHMASSAQISKEELNDLLLIVKDKVEELNKSLKTFVEETREKDKIEE